MFDVVGIHIITLNHKTGIYNATFLCIYTQIMWLHITSNFGHVCLICIVECTPMASLLIPQAKKCVLTTLYCDYFINEIL